MKYHDHKIYAQEVIREVVEIIDRLATIYRLDPPIVVTSNVRLGDPKYHGKAQAKDIRISDWPTKFAVLVGGVLKQIRKSNPKIQFEFEADHLHCEYDDKSL